ncbi:hypothetical protein [Nocardia sp. NPDC057455]|uniref:hypothetical protein n=1 Tax=Nocardia sp. NPDC057455 TaxID=3346138 RepID=UPI00366C09E7
MAVDSSTMVSTSEAALAAAPGASFPMLSMQMEPMLEVFNRLYETSLRVAALLRSEE